MMKPRQNQKIRRRSHREVGIFSKRGVLRVVELHPTKGFREQNGENWRGDFEKAAATNSPIKLARGKTRQVLVSPVQTNKPKIMHRKTG
jgi:hypothetical protein